MNGKNEAWYEDASEEKKSKQVTHKMSTINSWSRDLDIKKVKRK